MPKNAPKKTAAAEKAEKLREKRFDFITMTPSYQDFSVGISQKSVVFDLFCKKRIVQNADKRLQNRLCAQVEEYAKNT